MSSYTRSVELDLSYEDALQRLEQLLAAMEDGEVPLADLVAKFAEGNKLLKLCEKRLHEAELKVEKLRGSDAVTTFEPVAPDEDAS